MANIEKVLIFEKQRYISVAAASPISEEDCERLSLYKSRYVAIKKNFIDLIGNDKRISFSLSHDNGKTRTQKPLYNPHRLKGLYLDYRVFEAKREPTNFLKVCKILKRYFEDSRVRICVEKEIQGWNSDEFSDWHGYKFDELVDIIFNAKLFHSDTKKQSLLRVIYDNFADDALNTLLFHGIQMRLAQLRNIHFIIGPCNSNYQFCRLPVK